jgi:hypothetical protein
MCGGTISVVVVSLRGLGLSQGPREPCYLAHIDLDGGNWGIAIEYVLSGEGDMIVQRSSIPEHDEGLEEVERFWAEHPKAMRRFQTAAVAFHVAATGRSAEVTVNGISRGYEPDELVYTVDFWFDDQTAGSCEFTISADRQPVMGSCDCYGGRPALVSDLEQAWANHPESRAQLASVLNTFDEAAR